MELELFYLVIIKKGPRWTAEESPELDRLQEAHLAHIDRLRMDGLLVAAGPIDDGSDVRGITVLSTKTYEQAAQLALEDPSVCSGRLSVEIHPWYVPARTFCGR